MGKVDYESSLIAAASITNKSENQDSFELFEGSYLKVVVIADGIGSTVYAREAAVCVTRSVIAQFEKLDLTSTSSPDLSEIFKLSRQALKEYAAANAKEEDKENPELYGTTAIILCETEKSIKIGYVGNGSIWHIRGNFTDFPDSYAFPWNAVNYLNPHTVPENGKEALYRSINNGKIETEALPTIMEIIKDPEYGDMFMISTDGISSPDQIRVGKNEKGLWTMLDLSVMKYFDRLKKYFLDQNPYSQAMLKKMLEDYLTDIRPSLDDDATIGMFVSQQTLRYQSK